MNSILRRLRENRLDEATKKKALEALASELENRLKTVAKNSHHRLLITPNTVEGCVDIEFEGTDDRFAVYPQKSTIVNNNSNKVVHVSSIDGAFIVNGKVYDENGNLIGDALVRMKAIHNKSDFSTSLEDAEYRFNSKIVDIKKLEKYVAKEVINNLN